MAPFDQAILRRVIVDRVPAGSDVGRVDLWMSGPRQIVSVVTSTPGKLIGRRGSRAQILRSALAEHLGDDALQLNVEAARPPEEPPDAGDREPRQPYHVAPAARAEVAP
jgi:ribosomal protein S3